MTDEFVYIRVINTYGTIAYAEGVLLEEGRIFKAKRIDHRALGKCIEVLNSNELAIWVARVGNNIWYEFLSPLELLAMEA